MVCSCLCAKFYHHTTQHFWRDRRRRK